MEVNPNSKAAVSPAALCSFTHQMGSRLTQLSLANNTIAGLTQILNSVAENCPELQVFIQALFYPGKTNIFFVS